MHSLHIIRRSDSGCTGYLSSDESIFVILGDTYVSVVNLANNGTTEVKSCGKAVIKAEVNNNIQTFDANYALFILELRTNLLSVAELCDREYIVTFKSDVATLINAEAKVKLVADRKDNLYYLRGSDTNQSAEHYSESLDTPKTKCADLVKWHCRLGHLNMKDLMGCPTKALSGKTSYELFNEIAPNVSYFKTCGCTAYCLDNKPGHKFSARSKKGILVGYSENSKAFRIYLPDEKRFIISRNVKFFENGNINSSIDIDELFIPNKNLSDSQMEQEIAEIHTQNDVTEENHNKSS
ncbi:hypothetical protein AVEN_80504-1, partial [Araneus ventricosus]